MNERITTIADDIQISVMRSAKLGDVVDFESEVLTMGKNIAFIDVTATTAGKIIASARVTKSILRS